MTAPLPLDPGALFVVGQRFVFAGLPGQEPFETRMPGSGSVGWTMEVICISPCGNLGMRIDPEEPHEGSHTLPVDLVRATLMVQQGYWRPVAD